MATSHPAEDGPHGRLAAARDRYRGSWIEHIVARLKAMDAFDWPVIFGAELLWSVLPLFILLSSFADHAVENDLSRHIGLDSQGAAVVRGMFRGTPSHAVIPILTGLLLALAGTIALVGSMQVLYERLFALEQRGWRDLLRQLVWLVVLLVALAAQALVGAPVRSAGGPILELLVRFPAETLFFWWTMHFLLAARLPWRVLFRPALATAVLWLGLALFSSVFFSDSLVSDSREFGTIGVVFTLLSWFVLIGTVVVLGAAFGGAWQERATGRKRDAESC
jgi:membrane protein